MATGFPDGFMCLGLIDSHDSEKCILESSQIEALKPKFPKADVFMPPNPNLAADYVSPGWVTFPKYPFEIGLTFPFSPMISRFFEVIGLAFTQLMPIGWRNLVTLDRLNADLKLRVGLEELAFCYFLRSHGPHRYGFRAKNKVYSLVTESTDQDRDWKRKFFYVRRDSLQGVENFFSIWKEDDDTLAIVESVCLQPANKRKFVRPVAIAGIEGEREEVGQNMSSATQSDNPFGASNLLARFKKPKVEVVKQSGAIAEGSSKAKLLIGDPVLFKKRKAEVVNVEDSDSIVANLLVKIQDAYSMLAKEVELWKAKAEEIKAKKEKALKDKDAKIMSKDNVIKGLKADLGDADKRKKKEFQIQEDRFVKEAGRSVFDARIQMIEEYLAGKAGEWNLEDEKASFRGITGSILEVGEVSSKPQNEKPEGQVEEKRDEKVDDALEG